LLLHTPLSFAFLKGVSKSSATYGPLRVLLPTEEHVASSFFPLSEVKERDCSVGSKGLLRLLRRKGKGLLRLLRRKGKVASSPLRVLLPTEEQKKRGGSFLRRKEQQ